MTARKTARPRPITKPVKRTTTQKPTDPRLKTYLDATKHKTVLLGPVDQYLQLRPRDFRRSDIFHPSEMARSDWCHRADWYRLTGHTAPRESLRLRPNLIFEEGHNIHTKWQRWFREMGILWGRWECLVCHHSVFAWSNELPVEECPKIVAIPRQGHHYVYKEVPFDHPTLRIGGHADGIVNPTLNEPLLIEIKSIGPGTLRALDVMADDDSDQDAWQYFAKVNRPLKSHVIQTMIYLRLSEQYRNDIGRVSRGVIIYESKADQQAREFVVTADPQWTDPIFDAVGDILWAIGRGRDVPCNHGGCARCAAYEKGAE